MGGVAAPADPRVISGISSADGIDSTTSTYLVLGVAVNLWATVVTKSLIVILNNILFIVICPVGKFIPGKCSKTPPYPSTLYSAWLKSHIDR